MTASAAEFAQLVDDVFNYGGTRKLERHAVFVKAVPSPSSDFEALDFDGELFGGLTDAANIFDTTRRLLTRRVCPPR